MNMQYLDNSVTIVLSVSGENSITIDHISKLKREGSKIISITNNQHCTISRISDLNIAYYVTDERVHRANITTQTPVVYILEAMARDMFAMLKESKRAAAYISCSLFLLHKSKDGNAGTDEYKQTA